MLSNTKKGFTLIEVLIASFVLGVIVVGVFSLLTLLVKTVHDSQRRIVAAALANERMEVLRNLPYASVGTVGGVPVGFVPQSEQVTRNNETYTVNTDIRYVDDPYDGTATSNPVDTINTDYKQVRIEVTWPSNLSDHSVLLISQISPSVAEAGASLGTLVFQALNAAGAAVAGATVQLVNSSVSPPVNITTSTNSDGLVVIPGLPVSSGTYALTVSKNGYTTEQTYPSTSSFTPNVDHAQLSSIAGSTTNKTFAIDKVSSLTIKTVNEVGAAIGNVAYTISGTKTIGTDAANNPVYLFSHQDSTDSSGLHSYQQMTWDSYSFTIDGQATGYDIKDTSSPVPLRINPGTDTTLTVTLVPHFPYSLHVTVLDVNGQAIPNASVQVTRPGFDQTLQTGASGQVFFNSLHGVQDYTITITASGYILYSSTVTVFGTTQYTATLANS